MSKELTEEKVVQELKDKGLFKEDTKAAVEPKEVKTETQYTEVEQEAIKQGWNPNGPKSAQTFLDDGELYQEISKRGKKIKTLESKLNLLENHVTKLRKSGYQEQLNHIKAERREAIARNDPDSVEHYDEQLVQLSTEMQRDETPQEEFPEAMQFVDKYRQTLSDPSLESQELKAWVLEQDVRLKEYGLSPEKHYEVLEANMKKKFPHVFQAEEASEPVLAVESDSRPISRRNAKKTYSYKDLDKDQQFLCDHFVSRKILTQDAYIQQLVDMGEL